MHIGTYSETEKRKRNRDGETDKEMWQILTIRESGCWVCRGAT